MREYKVASLAFSYRFVQNKRSEGILGSNRPSSPRNLESEPFSGSLDRFQSIWIDSDTFKFLTFRTGLSQHLFRKADLEKLENRTRNIDFGTWNDRFRDLE